MQTYAQKRQQQQQQSQFDKSTNQAAAGQSPAEPKAQPRLVSENYIRTHI